jgi:membrane-associated protease RseP (regulator of RpoE activity)
MVSVLFLIGRVVYIYVSAPEIVKAIKVPPITPLIPYLPQIFKIDFLPPFYFTYWIIIIALIAVPHEFAHGIFSRYIGVKVKSTGFGFLGPFLAAFVEPDEEEMKKKSIFEQLSVLSAGTFANILTAVFFLIILIGFFQFAFTPAGVIFDTYTYSPVNISSINSVNNIDVNNPTYENIYEIVNKTEISDVETDSGNYLATKEILESQKGEIIFLYGDYPAVKAGLTGVIVKINDEEIRSLENLEAEFENFSPGEEITVVTKSDNETLEFKLTLAEDQEEEGRAVIGIGFFENSGSGGLIQKMYSVLSSFREPHVYYEAKSNFVIFVNDLLWWIILISVSVALINMLPVGIFDGGRVFYLTILAFLKNEKKAENIFSGVTYFFLFLLLIVMISWVFTIF